MAAQSSVSCPHCPRYLSPRATGDPFLLAGLPKARAAKTPGVTRAPGAATTLGGMKARVVKTPGGTKDPGVHPKGVRRKIVASGAATADRATVPATWKNG